MDDLQEDGAPTVCPPHPGLFFRGLCLRCGQPVTVSSEEEEEKSASETIPLTYIHRLLTVSTGGIAWIREASRRKLLRERKLILVLDLDHTLLNSTLFSQLSPGEERALDGGGPERGLHRMEKLRRLTKLRPFAQKFLQEVSSMFELYVYTMATRHYAAEMVRILDPDKACLGTGRVITRGDCTQPGKKGLDVVLGDERMVVIIDDLEVVWRSCDRRNLVIIEGYKFFAESCSGGAKSLCELGEDESEMDGALAAALDTARYVHRMFFGGNGSSEDVREILEKRRAERRD